jgi:hypothetical protein
MTVKKQKSFNSIVHHYAKTGFNLSRRDNLIFYKLLGFLIRNEKPFPYSNEKLALNTLYKISSIKESLNNLENIGLIAREGFSYQRRFYKGKTLINICTHSQYCIYIDMINECTHGQEMAGTSQKVAGTGQNLATIELNKNVLKLKEKFAHATSRPKHPPLTEEQRELVQNYEYDLRNPNLLPIVKGLDIEKAKVLIKRHQLPSTIKGVQ